MSLTFPRTDILTGLDFVSSTPPFKPLWRMETSRSANGVSIIKELGPLLWLASYETVPMQRNDAAALESDLLSLDGGTALFEGYDPRRVTPVSDSVSALASVTVHTIQADRRALRIAGVTSSFVLTKGDWLSIYDGTNLNLVQCVETVTAVAGLTPFFEIRPAARIGIATSDPVVLRYAPARFQLDRDSVKRTHVSGLLEAVSFSAIQVLE